MRRLNVTFGVLRKEKCTGDPARRLGNDLAFSQLAENNLETLKQNKVKKIVSICPHCVRTIGTDWKEYGEAPPIEHHSEFLARHLDQLPEKTGAGETIVYHDPCYLGRYRGVYDDPRSVVGRFGTVIDPPRARERSFCCGAGGGLAFLGEEKGQRVSVTRAKELRCYRRHRCGRCLSVLQYDVPRRAVRNFAESTAPARHRADRRRRIRSARSPVSK